MVELLPSESQRFGLRQWIELSDCVQRSTICPGFVVEGFVEEHCFYLTHCLKGRVYKHRQL